MPEAKQREEVPAVATKTEGVQKAAEQPVKREVIKPSSDKGELQASPGGNNAKPKKKRAKKEKEPPTKRICASWAKRSVHAARTCPW